MMDYHHTMTDMTVPPAVYDPRGCYRASAHVTCRCGHRDDVAAYADTRDDARKAAAARAVRYLDMHARVANGMAAV